MLLLVIVTWNHTTECKLFIWLKYLILRKCCFFAHGEKTVTQKYKYEPKIDAISKSLIIK